MAEQTQETAAPNPIANGAPDLVGDGWPCAMLPMIGVVIAAAISRSDSTRRMTTRRRRPHRWLDSRVLPPLQRTRQRAHSRSQVDFGEFVFAITAVALMAMCVAMLLPVAGDFATVLADPLSASPNPYGPEIDFALLMMIGHVACLLGVVAYPNVRGAIAAVVRVVRRSGQLALRRPTE